MKRFAVLLAAAGLCAASPPGGTPAKTFTGVIHDNRCSDGVCASECPVNRKPKFTLQTETDGWQLSDQKASAKYVGKKVRITGHLTGGNKLKVASISLAGAIPPGQAH